MSTLQPNIKILMDDRYFAHMLEDHLFKSGFRNISILNSAKELLKRNNQKTDVIITDEEISSQELVSLSEEIQEKNPETKIIVLGENDRLDILKSRITEKTGLPAEEVITEKNTIDATTWLMAIEDDINREFLSRISILVLIIIFMAMAVGTINLI